MAKGTIYLIVASVVFSLTGYAIHFWLGREMGPAEYGAFGVVLYLMTTINLFITSGIPRSVSKYVAEGNYSTKDIVKYGNRLQLIFCAIVFVLYLGFSGVIANFLKDPSLTPYIRISALAVPTYALYSIYNTGYLNGLRKFGLQALTSMGDSVIKLAAVFGLVLLGFGVGGALAGYVLATLVAFLLAWRFVGPLGKSQALFDWKKLLSFSAPATGFAVAFFLLVSLDLFAVKAMGIGEIEVGYYTSATTVSRAPYYLFSGLAMSLFPSISRSTSTNNADLTASYIRQSMRYMLMLLVPSVLLISVTSKDLLSLVYSSRYIDAAVPLSVLSFGLGFLTIFFVLSHMIMGRGKPGVVLFMALILVAMDIGLNILLIPTYGLTGAAWATTITGLAGMCAAAVYVLREFKTLLGISSLIKISVAATVIYAIAAQVSFPPLWLPAVYTGLFALYAGILWLLKELNKDDLRTVRKVVPLLKSPGIGNRTS
ncbi:MAG: oligosaccharide flippase family protein [Dehalococcoidales bacterium]|nr:oligosaccharide flippase family protein [Dehalococcoidales bacterium]